MRKIFFSYLSLFKVILVKNVTLHVHCKHHTVNILLSRDCIHRSQGQNFSIVAKYIYIFSHDFHSSESHRCGFSFIKTSK